MVNVALAVVALAAAVWPTDGIVAVMSDSPAAGIPFLAFTALLTWLLLVCLTVVPDLLDAQRRQRLGAVPGTGGLVTALVIVEGVVIVVLALLVVGLLRSHAEILRRLHDLGAGVEAGDATAAAPAGGPRPGRDFQVMPQVPSPPDREGFTAAADLSGAGVERRRDRACGSPASSTTPSSPSSPRDA